MITGLYAAILGLMFLGLTWLVILARLKYKVTFGDAGQDVLTRRIRAHGNFAEMVPMALILMILYEMQNGAVPLLHGLGIMLVLSRIIHVPGILRPVPGLSMLRVIGSGLVHIVIAISAIMLLWIYCTRVTF